MLRKLVALSIFTTLIALMVVIRTNTALMQAPGIQGDEITLTGRARRVKASGVYQLNITTTGEFDGVPTFDDALARYSVMVVEPLLSRTYVIDDIGLRTWHKFRVQETLSQKPYYTCSGCVAGGMPTPPADMLPLNSNEILVYTGGGDTVIEDVAVKETISDSHTFLLTQKYLLFLNYDASQQAGAVDLGPEGIFMLRGTDALDPVHVDANGIVISSPVSDGVATRYANSLTQFRNVLNPPPPPTSCDPDGSREMNCYNSGGDWNPTNCRCTVYNDPCASRPWKCDQGPLTY